MTSNLHPVMQAAIASIAPPPESDADRQAAYAAAYEAQRAEQYRRAADRLRASQALVREYRRLAAECAEAGDTYRAERLAWQAKDEALYTRMHWGYTLPPGVVIQVPADVLDLEPGKGA